MGGKVHMLPNKSKQVRKKKYKFGSVLLEELLQSGKTLVTGPFYCTAFLIRQIERSLDDKIDQSSEISDSFTNIQADFSSLKLREYCIDLRVFDAFQAYDQSEMEQWKQAGFDQQELEGLRDEYLYGEVWKKEDEYIEDAQYYDRVLTIPIIDSLAINIADLLTGIAKSSAIPLYTVISIFKGLLYGKHNRLKLMVQGTSESALIPQLYFDIANKIHGYWEEVISIIALMVSNERLWVDTCRDNPKNIRPMKLVRSFLLRSSFHLCQEDSVRSMSDKELEIYLANRFMPIEFSYDALTVELDFFLKKKGENIVYKTGEYASTEEFSLGVAISKKFLTLFLLTYRLRGSAGNIAKYMKAIFYRLGSDIISKVFAEKCKASGKVGQRSKRRYETEFYEEFELKLEEDSDYKDKEIM